MAKKNGKGEAEELMTKKEGIEITKNKKQNRNRIAKTHTHTKKKKKITCFN